MTWVKVDDQFHAHPKVLAAWQADHAALALHVRALSHCAAYLTDGHVSETWVHAQLTRAAERSRVLAALLAIPPGFEVGMWEPASGGWLIHDYLAYNDSREEVLAERAKRAAQRRAAGRRGARKRWPNGSSPYGEQIAPGGDGKPMAPARPTPDLFPSAS